MTTLNKADIQGNILRGYTFPCATYLFFEITDVARTRAFLRMLEVTPATPWPAGKKPETALNVALSYAGLARLCHSRAAGSLHAGFSRELLEEMAVAFPAFKEGMLARAALLGDKDASSAEYWQDAQVWVSVFAASEEKLTARVDSLRRAATGGLRLLASWSGRALERNGKRYEHFGFQDNISNPEIEGAREPSEPTPPLNSGSAKRDANGSYSPICAGEFLLGYESESGETFDRGRLGDFVKNGSFAVFRVLEQDVAAFRSYVQATAAKLGRAPAEIGALIVGREQEGAPLSDHVHDDGTLNNFGYHQDRDGARCPLASHVRRTHPRDASGVEEVSHRLLRRGMPYGPPLRQGALENDDQERGLFFIALNASIERQFEFVQRNWVNAPTGTGLDDDFDPLLSCGKTRMVLPGCAQNPLPRVIGGLPQFVRLLGGGYFFMPGMAALASLSEGTEAIEKGRLS